jgi:hypothetical protein
LLDAQGGVSDRYLQAFGFGNYWAVDSSQLDYLLIAKPSFRLLDRAERRFIPRIRKNLAEVLWLIGQEALASGARQIAEVVRRFLAWSQYCARFQTACISAMAKVQPDSAASMPGSRRWRRIGCLSGKSGERQPRQSSIAAIFPVNTSYLRRLE